MDKKKPTYDLESFKSYLSCQDVGCVTKTAFKSALQLGFNHKTLVEFLNTIQRQHFYKSTTSFADHKVWQDVYLVDYEETTIKFTATPSGFRLLSFKEK